jgi:RNA polymerase sigma-70 factor (family 1)
MAKQLPDEQLMVRFRSGDPRAFRTVYDQFFPALCFFARRLVNDHPEGEEIAADSITKLLNRHKDFDSLSNVKAFLYISTRNACLNYLKYAQRINTSKNELSYLQRDDKEEYILADMIHAEVLREIHAEIQQLPKACRKVFELLYVDGMKAKEVAAHLNISIHTVWAQRAKALDVLRTSLLKKGLLSALIYLDVMTRMHEN